MRAVVVFVALALVLVGLAGGLVWYIVSSGPQPLAVERDLFEAKNRGLAELENGRFAASLDRFRTVMRRVPDDPLGPQNLAVAGLSLMGDRITDPEAYEAGRAAAEEGLRKLDTLPVDRSLRLRLLGRFHVADGNVKKAAGALTEAAHDEPDQPDLWYEAYVAARDAGDRGAPILLEGARRQNPSNLFLIAESLPVVDRKSENFADLIDWAKRTLEPLAEEIRTQSGVDVLARLDEAAADPDAAIGKLREVANVIRPQPITQSDRLDIDRNLLEFVRTDFRPAFYDRYRPDGPDALTPDRFPFSIAETEAVAVDLLEDWGGRIDLDARITPIDFDLDGTPELAVSQYAADDASAGQPQPTVAVVSFEGSLFAAAPFDDVFEGIREASDGPSGLIPVDLDNDFDTPRELLQGAGTSPCRTADLDLIAWSGRGVVVLRNVLGDDGSRSLEPVAQPDALSRPDEPVQAVAVLDVESDGDLDLAVAIGGKLAVFVNDGEAVFTPSTRPIVQPDAPRAMLALEAVDLDGDFDLDLVALTGGALPLAWFENVRRGILRHRPITKASLGPGAVPEALAVLEGTGDGVWDLAVVAGDDSIFVPGRSSQPGRWNADTPRRVGTLHGPPLVADLDRDGWPELVAMGAVPGVEDGRPAKLIAGPVTLNRFADKRAKPVSIFADAEAANRSQRFLAPTPNDRPKPGIRPLAVVHPLDADSPELLFRWHRGFLMMPAIDDRLGNAMQATLLAEQVKDGNGQPSGRVNAYGVGTTLQLLAGERTITRCVTSPTTTFGLGDRDDAESLRILWTNGIPSHVVGPEAGQYVCEEQKLKGSCPYAYAWNGERFAFVTDLLWAAPIGLTDAAGQLVQPRPWEHLLIRGDQLRPRSGGDVKADDGERYELRLTEELWEAAYFDRVALHAIDHPADVEVFTNEKVGPPSVAEPLLHVVAERIAPVAADVDGVDVTDLVVARDDRYAAAYTAKRLQGLTDLADLTLAFDRVPDGPATLFLEGWLRPTDTSLNVAIAQSPRLDAPQPPALAVPDGDGWRTVRPFFGFPGGKTKVIAVDVTGLLDPADPRLRLTSSQELAYDAIWLSPRDPRPFDADADTATADGLTVTACPLRSAVLRRRGVSAMSRHPHGGPERFDYADVQSSPWRSMQGRFTRLGEVRELIAADDDRLAVIGSGDEIAIRFDVPPLADGLVRDFVLTSVGYDKDADLNTVLGDSSEPYPRAGVRYPQYQPLEDRSDAVWQTRRLR